MLRVFSIRKTDDLFPVYHEHDGEPILFHTIKNDSWYEGYWSFGNGYSHSNGTVPEDEVDKVILYTL